jgi:hypothetical protein
MNTIGKIVSFSELKKMVLELSVEEHWALLKMTPAYKILIIFYS